MRKLRDWIGSCLSEIDPDRLRVQLEILRAENDGSLKYQQAIAFLQADFGGTPAEADVALAELSESVQS